MLLGWWRGLGRSISQSPKRDWPVRRAEWRHRWLRQSCHPAVAPLWLKRMWSWMTSESVVKMKYRWSKCYPRNRSSKKSLKLIQLGLTKTIWPAGKGTQRCSNPCKRSARGRAEWLKTSWGSKSYYKTSRRWYVELKIRTTLPFCMCSWKNISNASEDR